MAGDNNLTALVNRALGYLGEQKITNCDSPETPAGRLMVDNYSMCRREVLRRVPWNFAECWGALAYYKPAPTGFDYTDTYALPADYIRILDIPGLTPANLMGTTGTVYSIDYSSDDTSIQDYRFIQMDGIRLIALDNNTAATLNVAYICDVQNLTLWDPLALKVLSGWMAIDVAKGITGMDSLVMQLDKMLTYDLQDAAGVNGNEQRKRLHGYSKTKRERELASLGGTGFFTPVVGFQ